MIVLALCKLVACLSIFRHFMSKMRGIRNKVDCVSHVSSATKRWRCGSDLGGPSFLNPMCQIYHLFFFFGLFSADNFVSPLLHRFKWEDNMAHTFQKWKEHGCHNVQCWYYCSLPTNIIVMIIVFGLIGLDRLVPNWVMGSGITWLGEFCPVLHWSHTFYKCSCTLFGCFVWTSFILIKVFQLQIKKCFL